MDFAQAWNELEIGAVVKVSNGTPPMGTPGSVPRNVWLSHNFTGSLEEKVTEDGWRYLKLVLPDDPSTPEVEYRAYTVAEGGGHSFELVE